MKLTLNKVLLIGVFSCIGCIIIFNTYNIEPQDHWTGPYMPWGKVFKDDEHRRHFPFYHAHVIRDKILDLATKMSHDRIWPDPAFDGDDRILAQMQFIPGAVRMRKEKMVATRLKSILLYDGLNWDVVAGQTLFIEQKCFVNTCNLTVSRNDAVVADAIIFKYPSRPRHSRSSNQIWVWYQLESPLRVGVGELEQMDGLINWTATYRHDSTIVTPYEKFVPYSKPGLFKTSDRNYAQGKTKKVVWFVSYCGSDNNRVEYARELTKYIEVDTFGGCGELKCPKGDDERCFSVLNTDYKFFLAFENCNCRDYITEKLFVKGLQHDVIPVVMGAAPEDYARSAPFHSYIHVEEFDSPKALASYLHLLDQRDDLYNAYFAWKGLGRFINTRFWCRLCALLHEEKPPKSHFANLSEWWTGMGVCLEGSQRWSDHGKRLR